MLKLYIKRFDQLNVNELYEILKLRQDIFILEQQCLYPDIDFIDEKSLHIYYQEKEKIIAYLRMFEKDTNTCQLGRIISLNRRQGFGTSLINETLQLLKQEKKYAKVYVEAQKYAIEFYEKLGFYVISDVFLDDGIEHVKMERFL